MKPEVTSSQTSTAVSRRDFLKAASAISLLLSMGDRRLFSGPLQSYLKQERNNIRYTAFRVSRLGELRDFFLYQTQKPVAGKNAIFRSYIDGFEFTVPEKLKTAESVIILAIPLKIAVVNFHYQGRIVPIVIPPGYCSFGYKLDDVKRYIRQEIIGKNVKLEFSGIPLKLASVFSGLARYGKNNITYVRGMGSYFQLLGFFTDHEFEKEDWSRVKPLRLCKGCYICQIACPTKCIKEESFLINIDKCVTLYNEIEKPIPEFFTPGSHNSLVGCMKCQWECPANLEHNRKTEVIAELEEKETRLIVRGMKDPEIQKVINRKLKRFPSVKNLNYISRNLNLLLTENSDVGFANLSV